MCSGVSSSLSQNLHKEVRNSSSFSSLLCLLKKQCPVSHRQARPKRSLPSLTMYLDLFLSVFGNHILVCLLEFKPFHLWSHSLVKWLNVLDLKKECEGGSHGPGPKATSVVPFLASWQPFHCQPSLHGLLSSKWKLALSEIWFCKKFLATLQKRNNHFSRN